MARLLIELPWATVYQIIAAGTFTMLGVFIDFMMSDKEKQRLRDWLGDIWLKLSYVKFPTVGRSEAEAAIHILDSVAGARLISWRRLMFSIGLVIAAAIWAHLYALTRTGSPVVELDDGIIDPEADYKPLQVLWLFVEYGLPTAEVALGISLTRWLASKVLALRLSLLPAGFIVMLAIHFLLLLWGEPLLRLFEDRLGGYLIGFERAARKLIAGDPNWFEFLCNWITGQLEDSWYALDSIIDGVLTTGVPYQLHNKHIQSVCFDYQCVSGVYWQAFSKFPPYVINGVRIAFALLFVGAIAVGPVARWFLLRTLLRISEWQKGVFSLVFGAASTLLLALKYLVG